MSRYRTVKYHSQEWAELVEQGWTTWTVNDMGYALMFYR